VQRGSQAKLPAVCTGNWGCGAFGGDKQLKGIYLYYKWMLLFACSSFKCSPFTTI